MYTCMVNDRILKLVKVDRNGQPANQQTGDLYLNKTDIILLDEYPRAFIYFLALNRKKDFCSFIF